jgi:dihydrofolate reductase
MSTPKLTYHAFFCTSVDGFIARDDGSVNFPEEAIAGKKLPEGEDGGIAAFMSSVNAIIMGKTTFEQVLGFKRDGLGWQYGDTPLFVLTTSLQMLPEDAPKSVILLRPADDTPKDLSFVVDTLSKHFKQTAGETEKRIYVDGGSVVRQFIEAGLLHELTTTIIPILLGTGIRLFGALKEDVKMNLVETKSWNVGYAQLRYKLKYAPEY